MGTRARTRTLERRVRGDGRTAVHVLQHAECAAAGRSARMPLPLWNAPGHAGVVCVLVADQRRFRHGAGGHPIHRARRDADQQRQCTDDAAKRERHDRRLSAS